MLTYYAHSKEDAPQTEWQSLDEHLRNVAEKAADFGQDFASSDWCWNAGCLHDLGKADERFQAYLAKANGLDDVEYDGVGNERVNHSGAGAAYAIERMGVMPGKTLAYLSAGHHAGLPDWHADCTANAALSVRLVECRENLTRIANDAKNDLTKKLRKTSRPPSFVTPDNYHLWVRMLYSCLVDADFLDTEAFMQPGQTGARVGFSSLPELKVMLDHYMECKAAEAEKTPVNATRQEILKACRLAAIRESGLFALTVPTGGGKTLSGMAFAIDHAVRHGKRRIIYVIPYTSIVEQTAGILRDIFGNDNVVEHHSNLEPEKETQRSKLASENWDAPVVVTTNVQFFESLFAAKSSRCRKLHNIANSVVILDEAQLIPPQWLTPCVHAIRELTENFGVTMVLATATQPALPGLTLKEIADNPVALYEKLKRTEIILPANMQSPKTWAEVAQDLIRHERVLCIVNSRHDCRELHALMPEGTIHLSALMCGAHRSKKIEEIKRLLVEGRPIRVISTQLVEAGVDIDFPVVYRAMAGLDSIAQAAGRCNREGKLPGKGSVHVFVPPKDPPRGLLAKAACTTRELAAMPGLDMQLPVTFQRYFELFYGKANDLGNDFLKTLQIDAPHAHVPFRSAADVFRFIDDSAQRAVIVHYDEADQWLERLRFAGPTREIMRRLQRYTVNLPTRMVDAMLADGRLVCVDEKNAPGIIVQACIKYDDALGLDVYAVCLPIEDLIT